VTSHLIDELRTLSPKRTSQLPQEFNAVVWSEIGCNGSKHQRSGKGASEKTSAIRGAEDRFTDSRRQIPDGGEQCTIGLGHIRDGVSEADRPGEAVFSGTVERGDLVSKGHEPRRVRVDLEKLIDCLAEH
jgi:hypothetical protein